MQNVLWVFLGGGLGSVLRYLTILGVGRCLPKAAFPWGVFAANIVGSFILGLLFTVPALKERPSGIWLFFGTGMLGGYTTFSTLANDSWIHFSSDRPGLALANAAGSIVCGFAAAALGWQVGRQIHG
jgi:CrcB protein